MDNGALLLGSAIFIVTIPYVFGPFWRTLPARQAVRKSLPASARVLKVERDAARREDLLALRDLEFDYQTGKVVEDDYHLLRAALLSKAASFVEETQAEEDALEALIRERRAQVSQESSCANCQTRLSGEDRFCPKCGAQQAEGCLACGAKLVVGARFCSSCGGAVGKE